MKMGIFFEGILIAII